MVHHNKTLTTQTKGLKSKFTHKLYRNLREYSRNISVVGQSYIVPLTQSFAAEIADIFNRTLVELLEEGNTVSFDDFGRYEIKLQHGKHICNRFTNYQDYELPDIKLIRFYPAKELKRRIKEGGKLRNEGKQMQFFTDDEIEKNIIESEENDDED